MTSKPPATPCFDSLLKQLSAEGVADDKLVDATLIGCIVLALLADAEAFRVRPLTRRPYRTRKAKRRNWSG